MNSEKLSESATIMPGEAALVQREISLSTAPTAEEIEIWLTVKFSEMLGLQTKDIDVHEPFARYGLGSIQAVSLTGDLEDWLELQLPSTLLWDYSTIEALAKRLAEEFRLSR